MSKLALTDLATLSDEESAIEAINTNNTTVETALENTLSRDGTTPNEMAADLDMDGYRVLNLPDPASSAEPATKNYVDSLSALTDSAALTSAVTAAQTAQAAAEAAQTAAEAVAAQYVSTSTTTLTPEVASKAFTITAGKAYVVGDYVLARSDASPTDVWMNGQVTDYTLTTLTVDVETIGSNALESSDWTIYLSAPIGPTGAAGTNGAAGADYTADDSLSGLSDASLSTTNGIIAQTNGASSPRTFTTRTITGTSGKITVTDGDGVAGNPTLTVGSDVMQTNVTKTMTAGTTHTPYDHGTLAGVSGITPLPSLGTLQKASIAAGATVTITAPTAEEGCCILQLTNAGAPVSVTFSSFDKTLAGATFSTTINKIHWVFIYSIGTSQVMNLQTIA
jgi:hypothetical protein